VEQKLRNLQQLRGNSPSILT